MRGIYRTMVDAVYDVICLVEGHECLRNTRYCCYVTRVVHACGNETIGYGKRTIRSCDACMHVGGREIGCA